MSPLRAYFASMTGRLFVLLAVGMGAAAVIATAISDAKAAREFERQLVERTADRLQAFVEFLDASPQSVRERLLGQGGPGIRKQPAEVSGDAIDTGFEQALRDRGGLAASATVRRADIAVCFPEIRDLPPPDIQRVLERQHAQFGESGTSWALPVCRTIAVTLHDGTPLRFSLDTPFAERQRSRLLDPAYIGLFSCAIALLAFVSARLATRPLRQMAKAATELGQDLDRAPIEVRGPSEVRLAAASFNAMQRRLQQHLRERTQMLAAITHDLQTPITRLRLRLERVEDDELRARLVADLNAMRALVDEGLELARSAETAESRVPLDLDSLLESLVEDAADAGADAEFAGGCGAVLNLPPLAMRRMFGNLLDNAMEYGGSAVVSAAREAGAIAVRVRDRGPGLSEDMLERAFEPFARGESSRSRETGGVGLGLTIARMLARKSGAEIVLRNHPDGGVEAAVRWPLPLP